MRSDSEGTVDIMRKAIMTILSICLLAAGTTVPSRAQEADPVTVLKSEATYTEKEDACRSISIQNGKDRSRSLV